MPYRTNGYVVFTLEEFLKKYPYKVGNKVQHKGATSCGSIFEVEKMRWEENTVKYTLRLFGCNYKTSTLPAEYLQPYKEDTIDITNKIIFDCNAQCCDIMNDIIEKDMKEIKIDIPKGYEFAGIDDDKQQVVFTKIGHHYPKTYEECCNVIGCDSKMVLGTMPVRYNTLVKLEKLLICRDAYWKIAGNEMGLDKPWEPDWTNPSEIKYCITNTEGNIATKWAQTITNKILAFPTAEIRDAFKENFDDDIEFCKEFL